MIQKFEPGDLVSIPSNTDLIKYDNLGGGYGSHILKIVKTNKKQFGIVKKIKPDLLSCIVMVFEDGEYTVLERDLIFFGGEENGSKVN